MKRLSEIHPFVYQARVWQKRLFRDLENYFQKNRFAHEYSNTNLAYNYKEHQSILRRKLGNSNPQLQENKITNLSIANQKINGILIYPKQVFSFWYLIGNPTIEKGYLEGMQIERGEVKSDIGGGLCQLANLLYWMVLHTPLEVIEHHHHSFDIFPDYQRILPFGSGAAIAYNYIDLRFYNPTDKIFQIRVWLTETEIKGGIYSDKISDYYYHVFEKNHHFFTQNNKNYRSNEIWRSIREQTTGKIIKEELLKKNFSEVKYPLEPLNIRLENINP